jgi:MFS family permease
MNGHASALEAERQTPIMSSFHAAWSLGGLSGAALGGAIQSAGLGVAAGLVLPDLAIGALVLAGALFALRDVGGPSSGSSFALPSAALLLLAGLAFLSMVVEGAVADWSAVYLRSALVGRPGAAALGYSSFALAMAACRMVGDVSVRRLGSRRVVTLGGFIAAAGLGLVLGLPSVATACLGFVLLGIGLANIVPVIFSAAGRSTAIPAVGVSMVATAGYAGFLVGPPLIGFSSGLFGLRGALCGLVLATLGVGLFGGRAVARQAGFRTPGPDELPAEEPLLPE